MQHNDRLLLLVAAVKKVRQQQHHTLISPSQHTPKLCSIRVHTAQATLSRPLTVPAAQTCQPATCPQRGHRTCPRAYLIKSPTPVHPQMLGAKLSQGAQRKQCCCRRGTQASHWSAKGWLKDMCMQATSEARRPQLVAYQSIMQSSVPAMFSAVSDRPMHSFAAQMVSPAMQDSGHSYVERKKASRGHMRRCQSAAQPYCKAAPLAEGSRQSVGFRQPCKRQPRLAAEAQTGDELVSRALGPKAQSRTIINV